MNTRPHRPRLFCIGFFALVLSGFPIIQAQTWMGGDGYWSEAANWSPAGVPGAGSGAVFNGSTGGNISIGWPGSVGSITFAEGAGAYTLGNGGISIGSGITNNSDRVQTIGAGAYITGGNLSLGGPGDLLFSSGSALNAAGYTVNGPGTVTFAGNVDGGSLAVASGRAVITGSGDALFSSAVVSGGVLVLDRMGGTAINGDLTVNSGGSVIFERDNQVRSAGTTLTLAQGAYIDLNGTSQSFENLNITGDAIIDFGDGSSLSIANWSGITIADDATLTIRNWNSAVDYFTIGQGYSPSILPKIIFEGWGDATWSGGFVKPGAPVPEPSAYGFLALGALGFAAAWRRRRVRA